MGGGDSGGDLQAQQAAAEAKKQAARDALNLSFGVAPAAAAMPTREQFTKTTPGASYGINYSPVTGIGTPGLWGSQRGASADPTAGAPSSIFDQAGYDAAVAAASQPNAEAEANKAARDKLYANVRQNAFTAGQRGLDEKRQAAERNNRFALFAQGLNGGSVDVDENALLGRTYSNGILDLGAKADAAKADLQSSDEQTRLGLLQSIDAGMDQGSALSSALNQLRVNSDKATANAQGTTLGDLFADSGLLYTKSNLARGQQAFAQQYPWATATAPRAPNRGLGGIITSTGG